MKYKAFIIYIATFSIDLGDKVYPLEKTQIAHLKPDKVFIKVFNKYANFIDVFSSKLVTKFSKYIGINDYAIKLINDWQFLYDFIYSLRPIELKILKTYIQDNLLNGFIKLLSLLLKYLSSLIRNYTGI